MEALYAIPLVLCTKGEPIKWVLLMHTKYRLLLASTMHNNNNNRATSTRIVK